MAVAGTGTLKLLAFTDHPHKQQGGLFSSRMLLLKVRTKLFCPTSHCFSRLGKGGGETEGHGRMGRNRNNESDQTYSIQSNKQYFNRLYISITTATSIYYYCICTRCLALCSSWRQLTASCRETSEWADRRGAGVNKQLRVTRGTETDHRQYNQMKHHGLVLYAEISATSSKMADKKWMLNSYFQVL